MAQGTPIFQKQSSKPYIPTGYEGLAEKSRQKRALAEALMKAGLAGPGDQARSYTQLLGSLAQAWAGKRLLSDADKADEQIRQQQLQAAAVANQQIEADASSGMPYRELAIKHGGNPLLQDRLKAFDHGVERVGDKFIDPRAIRAGSYVEPSLGDDLIRNSDGTVSVNKAKAAAKVAQLGLPINDSVTGRPSLGVYNDPTKPTPPNPLTSAPGFARLSPEDQGFAREHFPREDPSSQQRIVEALSQHIPQGSPLGGPGLPGGPSPEQLKLQPRFPATAQERTLSDGTKAYLVNGKWYDNPEGQ
jgi:hypothetical protein